jgi:biopolymer transport protein ExbD
MNLRSQRRDAPDINLTPLIDVVFLLLIFFMVSTTFDEDARLRLELPEADGEVPAAEERRFLEVVVDVSGRFYVDGDEVLGGEASDLVSALGEAIAEAADRALDETPGEAAVGSGDRGVRMPNVQDRPVLIKADAKTSHQSVMTLLDALGQLGLHRVAFATSRTGDEQ